nr:hypothetical protein [Tanacetum cinerariifolium]
MTQLTSMCELACQIVQKRQEEKRIEEEQAAKAQSWKFLVCYDDDDDEEGYNSLNDNIISELPSHSAVTPTEPIDSLKEKQLEEEQAAKAQRWKLPVCYDDDDDEESSKPLEDNIISELPSDDQSLYDEDVLEKIFSNPLFEEEIIPMKIDQHHDNAEFDLVESLRTYDSSLIILSKIDSLLDEFAGELTLLKSIPPGIDETDCDPKEDIRHIKKLLYDNSSPRPPKEFVSENSNAELESFSPFHIPVEDSNSLMEEIDLSFTPDDPMPSGVEEDDYDSKMDILILEELLDNYSLSLPENKSSHFDIPSSSHPPAKPPDGNT